MKKLSVLLLVAILAMAVLALTGCQREAEPPQQPAQEQTPAQQQAPAVPTPPAPEPSEMELLGLDENGRFLETQQLTVGIWDRGHERMPDMTDNGWTDWLKERALQDLNIEVEFISISRWDQGEVTSTLIGANSAPDVTFHFGALPMTNTFAEMGALLDLSPLLERYGGLLPDLYNWLDDLVYYNARPTGENFALSSRRTEIMRQNTFIREDWLNRLNIAPPTTLQEFEYALIAFRDNADYLLGADAHMMIPLLMDGDVGWALGTLIDSFVPNDITEREWFRYGFDDRRVMHPTTKEAIRVGNRWFNEGLVFSEFAYGEAGDLMPGFVREGFVGAQIANWDMPFRAGGDMQIQTMRENIGPEANFITITPFPNDAGINVLPAFSSSDRHIVLPHTNSNPLAALLYINFVSSQEVRDFMSHGLEGIHHIVEDGGARRTLPAAELPDNFVFAAVNNFDIQFVSNGFDLGTPELTVATLALAYAGIEPEAIMTARQTALDHARVWRSVVLRPIAAQEGMSTPLNEFRDTLLHNAMMAPVDQFDAVWDDFFGQYMAMGGQAIINERDQAWVEHFGNVDFGPGWEGW